MGSAGLDSAALGLLLAAVLLPAAAAAVLLTCRAGGGGCCWGGVIAGVVGATMASIKWAKLPSLARKGMLVTFSRQRSLSSVV